MTTHKNNISFVFVHIVIFICGSVLMSLEFSGSRVLAPYFGSSIFVWASLISVLLIALACGNYWGGNLADQSPSFTLWGTIIGLSGIFVLIIPLMCGPICRFITHFITDDRIGSLMATCCLFFLPSLLLGMVSPFAIKFSLPNVAIAGNVSGKLYAVSAIGNVFGTLFTAFYLITKLGIFAIFTTLGLILIVTAIAIICSKGTRAHFMFSIALAIISLILAASPAPALVSFKDDVAVRLEKDSFYHHIMIVDFLDKNIRNLHFDRGDQTSISLSGNHESYNSYTNMLHLPLVFAPNFKNALFIGAGGAIVPRNYSNDYPNIDIDLVEIDPIVGKISTDYFFLNPNEHLKLIIADGRRLVQNTDKIYDIVVLDAYFTKSQIPFHLLTKNFFEELHLKISPDGVLAINLGGAVAGKGSTLFLAVYRTLASVFNNLYVFPDINNNILVDLSQSRNIIIIASKSKERFSQQHLSEKMKALSESGIVKISNFDYYAQTLLEINPSSLSKAVLLTDDYAPVEHLMQNH